MKRKIFFSMCLVSLVAIIGTSVLAAVLFYNDFREKMNTEVVAEATYIKEGYETIGQDYLQNLDVAPNASGDRITVISADGEVVYDNRAKPSEMENHADRPEFIAARKSGQGEITRLSETINEETYYYAVLLSDGKVLRVGNTMGSVFATIAGVIPWAIGILIVMLLLSLFTATLRTKSIVQPINKIDLAHPDENVCYEELSPLLTKLQKQKEKIALQIDELSQKRREFEVITDNMSEGFVIINKSADVLSFNKSAVRLFKYDGCFENGESVYKLNHSTSFINQIGAALEGNAAGQTMNIGERFLQIIASPVTSAESISGAVIVMLDITEKEEREKMRREFSANVSHELKTPLTSISGYAEIMKNNMVKPEDVPRFSENIYNESQRLIALVQDIIKISKLDEGGMTEQKEEVELKSVAKDVAERLLPQLNKDEITLTVEGDECYVDGVRQMLFELIYNICENAVKYNKKGGTVRVTLKNKQDAVLLTVEDTGVGIEQAETERVFERFYRVEKSHSKETGGTGLGLSIVKHIAAYHDAKIALKSKENEGTTISVRFHRSKD